MLSQIRRYANTKWFSKAQGDEMVAYIRKCGKWYNTYININPRRKALDTYHRGESKDVFEVVGLYTDYDIKGAAHAEKCLPETADELQSFMDQLPIKPSLLVSSGNGVHSY